VAEPPRAHREEVDGILVAWGLEFRVARCDERLPTGGITHLVEHFAPASRAVARRRRKG
jgi:hypothetical protein